MSYLFQAKIANDGNISQRVTACVALEGVEEAEGWAWSHRWKLSAQPGWSNAYASAVANGIEEPGADESVITDSMILSAVQSILNAEQDNQSEEQ